ncbi:MAG: hypothetical protein AAF620_16655, partial [Bacteroidota bacterium]
LAVNYFDENFGTGADGYFVNSPNHFDRNSFVTGRPSAYFNPRLSQRFGRNIRNQGAHPLQSRFHWTDIPINGLYNGGLGLLGFWFFE